MIEIVESKDCGNSPKNRFAQDVAVALETGEVAAEMLSEGVTWTGVSDVPAQGIAAVLHLVSARGDVSSIVITHAIAHGKVGMANGVAVLADGTRRRFSHIFEFTNTKGNCVAAINSYG